MTIDRPFSFRLPMNEAERDLLHELALDAGMSATAYVRLLLKREHAARFGEPPPSVAPRRKAAKAGKRGAR